MSKEENIQINIKNEDCPISINLLKNREYVLSHMYVALQMQNNDKLVKRESGFKGVESYLYVKCEEPEYGIGTAKITDEYLELVGIEQDEAWNNAIENSKHKVMIKPILVAIKDLLQKTNENIDFLDEETKNVFVVTNEDMYLGACSILFKNVQQELIDKCGTRSFCVIPSSRHEVIVFPKTESIDLEVVSNLVKEVNREEVEPKDILADEAFTLELYN